MPQVPGLPPPAFLKMPREVLHINISAFPIGVERVVDSSIRERPVVVAAANSARAVALAVSREAYLEGVLKGMPVATAKKFCRGLIVIPPNERLYRRAATAVMEHLHQYSPLIEPRSAGHLYMDLSGTRKLFGPAVDTGARIQTELRGKYCLRSTVGVARNKLVSRVASRLVRPRGVCDIFAGGEPSFLAPLEVDVLPGIGPKTAAKLADFNILQVRELALIEPEHLCLAFGPLGYRMYRYSKGIDESPVRPPTHAFTIIEEETLDADSNDDEVIYGLLYLLCERAGARLRKLGQRARGLRVEITYADYLTCKGRGKPPEPMELDRSIYQAAERVLDKTWTRRTRLRYLSLTLGDLVGGPVQLNLFEKQDPAEHNLQQALDSIRQKFGQNAVKKGKTIMLPIK